MIIPDCRLGPKLECGKIQLSQIYARIKGYYFLLILLRFHWIRSNIFQDNPKWSFHITDLCHNWNEEKFNYPKFIPAKKGIIFYLFCPSFIDFGPVFSKIILNDYSRFQINAKTGMRKTSIIEHLCLHKRILLFTYSAKVSLNSVKYFPR